MGVFLEEENRSLWCLGDIQGICGKTKWLQN